LTLAAILVSGLLGACQPRAVTAECVPNHPFACTTMNGVALGRFERSVPADVEPCEADCSDPLETARGSLASVAPGHARLIRIDEFSPDLGKLCAGGICVISGGHGTFVFYFEDQTAVAIDIRCGIGPCRVISS
jgi:hypothetical protein